LETIQARSDWPARHAWTTVWGMGQPHHRATASGPARADGGAWRRLARLAAAVREDVMPGWFASVMGTGIVAVAATLLPGHVPGVREVAVAMWAAAAVLLVVLLGAAAGRSRGGVVRRQLGDPATAPFLGVPPMAVMTVGAGALLVGRDVIGANAAVVVAGGLWCSGMVAGVATAVVVPVAMARRGVGLGDVVGAWLLPVVPPMVAAATGAGLVAHAGGARGALLGLLYGLFALGLVGSAVVIALVVARLARHGVGPARTVPALWIVLGPLGQSVTAASLLGDAAGGRRETAFALWYGVGAWTCAMAWLALVAVLTARTARRGLPFSTAWWGFVFPVGTVVTGTSRLAERTDSATLTAGAIALFIMLVAFWALTAARAVAAAASPALR
jgi:tellurite resistance protein TehA-like permease